MPRETYKDYANEIYEKVKAAEAEKRRSSLARWDSSRWMSTRWE